jgi:hypothetical protein
METGPISETFFLDERVVDRIDESYICATLLKKTLK